MLTKHEPLQLAIRLFGKFHSVTYRSV